MAKTDIDFHAIKRELFKMKCPVHKEHAEITLQNKKFKISCCCEDFLNSVKDKSIKLIKDDSIKLLTDTLKNTFKK